MCLHALNLNIQGRVFIIYIHIYICYIYLITEAYLLTSMDCDLMLIVSTVPHK